MNPSSPTPPPNTRRARGALLARVLAGSWRRDLPSLNITPSDFKQILPLAVSSGVGGLVWRRIRSTPLEGVPGSDDLLQSYRHYAIQNAVHTRKLTASFALLRDAGIEPVLAKGWSLAPLYPDPGTRPFGDIDLCVRPSQFQTALELLEKPENLQLNVDLHYGFGKFYEDRTEELFERTQLVKLDDADIRVLKFEDNFRFLCLHLLRHGANRSLWLCDVAAALEAVPDDFDCKLALGNQQPQAEWVEGAIQVAHELLDANLDRAQFAVNGKKRSPRWLSETVLNEWGRPYVFPDQVSTFLRKPTALVRELPRHWPNAIEATVNLRGRFSEWPRFPFQLGEVFVKMARLLKHIGSK